jgi:hypothetical protein
MPAAVPVNSIKRHHYYYYCSSSINSTPIYPISTRFVGHKRQNDDRKVWRIPTVFANELLGLQSNRWYTDYDSYKHSTKSIPFKNLKRSHSHCRNASINRSNVTQQTIQYHLGRCHYIQRIHRGQKH